jgi:hypothetical protein
LAELIDGVDYADAMFFGPEHIETVAATVPFIAELLLFNYDCTRVPAFNQRSTTKWFAVRT